MEAGTERRGPLVRPGVHLGAVLLIVGAVQFVVGMAVTQLGWTTPYSLLHNYISDLGAVHCYYYTGAEPRYICSPWHDVFNTSIVLLGLILIAGLYFIRSAFPPRRTRLVGLGLLVLAGVGAIGVGLSPEDVNLTVHTASALVAFLLGNLGLIVVALAMLRDTRWDGFRLFSVLSGAVGLGALVLFVAQFWGPVGAGGMERLIVAPILLWAVVVGVHLLRIATLRPEPVGAPATG